MPSVAETLMRLHGTPEGQRAYPNDFYFRVSADAKPTFLMHELLTRQQFHSYFGKSRADLEKQCNTRLEYERKLAAKAAEEAATAAAEAAAFQVNPRHYTLERMLVKQLDAEIENINRNPRFKLPKSGKREEKIARLKETSLGVHGTLLNKDF